MAGLSDYAERKLADHLLGGPDYTRSANVWVSLHTTDPTDAGTGAEVSGNGYARAQVVNNSTNWPAATTSGGVTTKSNGTTISFPTATGSGWGSVTHFAIWDALSSGNMLGSGALSTPVTVNAGGGPSFGAGALLSTWD